MATQPDHCTTGPGCVYPLERKSGHHYGFSIFSLGQGLEIFKWGGPHIWTAGTGKIKMPPQTWNIGPRPQLIHATEKRLRPIVGGLVFSRSGAGTAGKWLLLVALCYCLHWCSAADAPVTLLPPNHVVEGQLASNSYRYYEVVGSGRSGQDLVLTATPLGGDVDLYVSLGSDLALPTRERYEWASSHLGTDSLVIVDEDPKNCQHQPPAHPGQAPAACVYRVGVFGYLGGGFSLLARWNNSEPVPLALGRPQSDAVTAGTFRQYSFDLSPKALAGDGGGQGADASTGATPAVDLEVLLHPLLGDPDMYVTLDGERPGGEHYQYQSSDWGAAVDRIVLGPHDPRFQRWCPEGRCQVRIGVYGFREASFSLLLSAFTEPIRLQLDQPISLTLRPTLAQRLTVPWPGAADVGSLRVSVSPQSGPAPRLYASCRSSRPNATVHDWELEGTATLSGQSLVIDTALGTNKGCDAGSNLTLAVAADSLASLSLLVSTDAAGSIPRLLPGLQTPGRAHNGAMAYFAVRVGGADYTDVELVLTVTSGEADMYVSDSYEGRPRIDATTGVVSSYSLSSAQEGDDRLTVKHSLFKDCGARAGRDGKGGGGGSGCFAIVGVLGRQFASSEFRLLAKTLDSTLTLHDGVAVRDTVAAKAYAWYKILVVNPQLDLTLALTPLSGDPDLYVGVPPVMRPTKGNHTWASRSFGADSLTVQAAELRGHCEPDPSLGVGCPVYVGVYAWSRASFSIMASLNTGWLNPSVLIPGLPQSGEVAKSAYHYYQFRIPAGVDGAVEPLVRITLLPEDDTDQDLYVTFSAEKEPGKENFDARSTSWSDNDEVLLAPGGPHYCTGCSVYVAVYGYDAGPYSLVATLSTTQQQLQLGVPVRGAVAAASSSFYVVDWQGGSEGGGQGGEALGLAVTLTPEAGRPQVYASCSLAYPNATTHMWALDSREDQVLHVNVSSGTGPGGAPCRHPGKLWLAVAAPRGGGGAASYSLLVAADNASTSMPLLVPGTPTAGMVRFHRFQYYQVRTGAGNVDMDVVLSVIRGQADVFVSQTFEGRPVYDAAHNKVRNWTAKSTSRGSDRLLVPRTLFPPCEKDCYFVLGVFGKSVVPPARYSLVARRAEGIVALQDGVALRDEVGEGEYLYFSFKLTDPEADVSIHLTPFNGDPDLFVAPAPNARPSATNHTWASRSLGPDTLTLQCSDMKTHCAPDPSRGLACDYFISVYGYENASFSLLVSLHQGWREPIELFPGLPQAGEVNEGEYVYYSFYVPPDTVSLQFVLTPQDLWGEDKDETDDWDVWSDDWDDVADQDLFLTTSRDREPGEDTFDLRSTSWAGVEEITYSAAELQEEGVFCTGCTVYLAVYGYAGQGGEYTLRVETGLVTLQNAVPVTGHLVKGGAAHYKIYSRDSNAHLLFSAVTLSGDADLYILAVEPPAADDDNEDTQQVLPSKEHYHWKGDQVGDDVVEIVPSDAHFCSECDFLVTVAAFTNTSYVLTASVEAMSIVPLAGGRPQVGHVDRDNMQYFSAVLGSSTEDLRVSLTLFSGHAEIFVADRVDPSRLPLPEDPTSWRYSSRSNSRGRNEVVIPGPHRNRTRFAIGVRGLEDASTFSILASFSQSLIFLQEGVPVQQSLAPGRMAWFVHRLARKEDVRVAVTALSGDPDILASTLHPRPACVRPPGSSEGETGTASYVCGNYTWMAQTYQSDELVILHDLPCEEVGNTRVNTSACAPYMLSPGHSLYVGVFAYDNTADTTFTLTLTTGSGHTKLLPGRPQHGNTRLGAICKRRRADGSCDTSTAEPPADSSKAYVAYYRFLVSPPSALFGEDEAAHVSVVLEPVCNATTFTWEGLETCRVGCPCDPLELYVWSCAESQCTSEDEYPHPDHYQTRHIAAQAYNTVFLAHDKYNPNNGFCNPQTAGEPCLYFITVYHPEGGGVSRAVEGGGFTITASTNHDVTILPTRRHPPPPDGLVSSNLEAVDITVGGRMGSKRYQMYAQQGGDVQLVLEPCTGSMSLAVCDGSCVGLYPTEHDYRYLADSTQTCTREGCRPLPGAQAMPRIDIKGVAEDSLFVAVNGTGVYSLRVAMTTEGHAIAPVLAPATGSPAPSLRHVHRDSVTVTWPAATLTVPGKKSGRGGGRGMQAHGVRYKVFAFPEAVLQAFRQSASPAEAPVLHTVCGVERYAARGQTAETTGEGPLPTSYVGDVAEGMTTHTVTGLAPGTEYLFMVVGSCDQACLRANSKSAGGEILPCGGAVPCQDQRSLYPPTRATTASGAWVGGVGSGARELWRWVLLVIGILAIVGFLVRRKILHRGGGSGGVLGRNGLREGRSRVGRPQQVDYEMTVSPTGSCAAGQPRNEFASPRDGRGAGRRRYERLVTQGEGEERDELAEEGVSSLSTRLV